MTDIVEFLNARLDEDEHFARAVEHAVGPDYDQLMVAAGKALELQMVSLYWRRHDPARVLREVEAKRRIVELHPISSYPERWGDVRHHPDQDWPRVDHIGELTGGVVYSCALCDVGVNLDADGPLVRTQAACETLLAIAAIYADHPDYDPAWALT